MQVQRYSLLLAALALAGVAWPGAAARLSVEAATAIARVTPVADRSLLRLPALEFEFTIAADCGPERAAQSVSISIADTRQTLAGTAVPPDAPVNTTISLPARQIPPVAVDGFCHDAAAAADSEQRLLRDVMTAHFSLRCTGPGGDSISYASRALDVTLVCEIDPGAQGAPASTDR